MWKPNIQKATLSVDGGQVKMKLCTHCLRTLAKAR
jgi:ribosomal protein L28